MKTLFFVVLAALLITAIAGAGSYAWNGGYWGGARVPAWMGYGDCPMGYGTLPSIPTRGNCALMMAVRRLSDGIRDPSDPPESGYLSRGYRDGYCFGPGMRGKWGRGGGPGMGYGRGWGW